MKHETKCSDPDTEQTIPDEWLAEGQRFLNQRFGDDLMFPIYVVRAPTEGDSVLMSISGGAYSLHYRDNIIDWQGGGYLIRLRKTKRAASNSIPGSCMNCPMPFSRFCRRRGRRFFPE